MYRVNEIFYSLQGEGRHTGRAAVFVRFSGCNLHCPFCDTDFSSHQQMTADDIVDTISQWQSCGFVVLTGGEPSLQVDEALVEKLHDAGFIVATETNGTHALPANIDWVTWSPKDQFANHVPPLQLKKINEIKVVFDGLHDPEPYASIAKDAYLCLQPCDTGNNQHNQQITAQCVTYIQQHPHWHLSLQTHKLINIP
ncbi:MAG: 7-carboxy-7-deazaguanine synthase QueE [Prevotella sp.]|nr:7-carboxy-7-deazaguanine synthase QueE [Prevotella sp.]